MEDTAFARVSKPSYVTDFSHFLKREFDAMGEKERTRRRRASRPKGKFKKVASKIRFAARFLKAGKGGARGGGKAGAAAASAGQRPSTSGQEYKKQLDQLYFEDMLAECKSRALKHADVADSIVAAKLWVDERAGMRAPRSWERTKSLLQRIRRCSQEVARAAEKSKTQSGFGRG